MKRGPKVSKATQKNSIFTAMYQIEDIGLIDCLLIGWLASVLIQLYFYLNYFRRLAQFSQSSSSLNSRRLSLIIAVKNESKNLKKNIPFLLEQKNIDFELLFVDDHSSDDSIAVIKHFQDKRIQLLHLEEGYGKKEAIQMGIKNASNNLLAFTDADCKPCSNLWLANIAESFSGSIEIVLGHSSFNKIGGFLNKLIRFENLIVASQYFSFALKKDAYMGVGRNLAYTKNIAQQSLAFDKHQKLRSGDDDLLVNEMANDKNTAIQLNFNAHTRSDSPITWKEYICQKRRQLQAGIHYRNKHRLLLALSGASTLLVNIFTLILLFISEEWLIILVTFVLISIFKGIILNRISKKLGDSDLIPLMPLLEFSLILTLTAIGVSTWIWKVDRWK